MKFEMDRHYLKAFPGKQRKTLHFVRRALSAKRNGVAAFFSFYRNPRGGISVHARNTKPGMIEVSRVLMIGPRGGLFINRKGGRGTRRYLKAAQIGKGWL